jgi:aspartate/methionine/tyrosine aminotransferase
LEILSKIIIENDLYLISDEVYDKLVFFQKHERIASIDGMWERTLTIGSAGKTFSVTGWKIGWMIGPYKLLWNCYLANQYNVFCVNTPMQNAIAVSLKKARENGFYEELVELFIKKSEMLGSILEDCGLKIIKPNSGYFMLSDISNVDFPYDESKGTRDYEFCRWLPKEIGVAAIPPSAFYSDENKKLIQNFARFCFCKNDETLFEASKRLKKLKK